jgi:hypothetical protein
MRRIWECLAVLVVLGGAGSCGDSAGTGSGGVLTVSLATPNPGADGAVLLMVTGPSALTSVTAATGLRVFSQALTATNHFAVTGPLPNGAILTIGVPDVSRVGEYKVTLQDVAANDYTLRSLAGYSLTVGK